MNGKALLSVALTIGLLGLVCRTSSAEMIQRTYFPPGSIVNGMYWPTGVYVDQWVPGPPPARSYSRSASSSGNRSGGIKRLPRYKSFGDGVRGELIEEEGEEEKVHRHRGTNRGRYRLYKYIPGHRDPITREWIKGHKEELGEEEVGEDLDKEDGKTRSWSWRKR